MKDQPVPDPRRAIGQIGEAAARDEIVRMGWTLLDHNVRWREGEIDVIALDRATIVFIEVKTLMARGSNRGTSYSPFESITAGKQKQLRRLAARWLSQELSEHRAGRRIDGFRFDAVAVTLEPDHSVRQLEHLEDAF